MLLYNDSLDIKRLPSCFVQSCCDSFLSYYLPLRVQLDFTLENPRFHFFHRGRFLKSPDSEFRHAADFCFRLMISLRFLKTDDDVTEEIFYREVTINRINEEPVKPNETPLAIKMLIWLGLNNRLKDHKHLYLLEAFTLFVTLNDWVLSVFDGGN